jgi:hypothetical protein
MLDLVVEEVGSGVHVPAQEEEEEDARANAARRKPLLPRLHLTHGFGCRPAFAPVPVQVVQVRVRSTRSVLCLFGAGADFFADLFGGGGGGGGFGGPRPGAGGGGAPLVIVGSLVRVAEDLPGMLDLLELCRVGGSAVWRRRRPLWRWRRLFRRPVWGWWWRRWVRGSTSRRRRLSGSLRISQACWICWNFVESAGVPSGDVACLSDSQACRPRRQTYRSRRVCPAPSTPPTGAVC